MLMGDGLELRLGLTCCKGSACMGFYKSLPFSATSSMQRDIEQKKPSELEYQNGAIVKLGKSNKVPVPVNSFIYYSLLPQELEARSNS